MPSENLQELEETFNAIHEKLEQQSKENSFDEQMDQQSDDEHSIISIVSDSNDSDEDDGRSDKPDDQKRTVKNTNCTIISLNFVRTDVSYCDGSTETSRKSNITYSAGLDPELIDFKILAINLQKEVPEHFQNKNKRFVSAHIL